MNGCHVAQLLGSSTLLEVDAVSEIKQTREYGRSVTGKKKRTKFQNHSLALLQTIAAS